MSATTKWIALALLGLAIAGGVAFAASRLVSEQIGIASESVSAGYDLAPAVRSVATPTGEGTDTGARGDATAADDPSGSAPAEPSAPEPAPGGGNEGPSADELDQREDEREDLEKQREDELEDQLKAQEDREDEIRDREEDRRDD